MTEEVKNEFLYGKWKLNLAYHYFGLTNDELIAIFVLAADIVDAYLMDLEEDPLTITKKDELHVLLYNPMFRAAYNYFRDRCKEEVILLGETLDTPADAVAGEKMLKVIQNDRIWNFIKKHKEGPGVFLYRIAEDKKELTSQGLIPAGFLWREVIEMAKWYFKRAEPMRRYRYTSLNEYIDPDAEDPVTWAETIHDPNDVSILNQANENMDDDFGEWMRDTGAVVLSGPNSALYEITEEMILAQTIYTKFGSGEELSSVYTKYAINDPDTRKAYDSVFRYFQEYYPLAYGEPFFKNSKQATIAHPEYFGLTDTQIEKKTGVKNVNGKRNHILNKMKDFYLGLVKEGALDEYEKIKIILSIDDGGTGNVD